MIETSSDLFRSFSAIFGNLQENFGNLRNLRKTVSYEEQIMSADKYHNILSRQIEGIV